MWTILFNIFIVTVFIFCTAVLIVCLVLLASLFVPIMLTVDTTKRLYALTFPGGRINFQEIDGVKGLEYVFLWKKGFTSFHDMIRKKKRKKGKEKTAEEEIEEAAEKADKKEKGKGLNYYLNILREEKELLEKIIRDILTFLWDLFKLIECKNLDGTFCIPDPYYNGLCFAVLGPLTRRNFRLMPNFDGNFHFIGEFLVMPSRVAWRFLGLLFSLPVIRMYKFYKKIKTNGGNQRG